MELTSEFFLQLTYALGVGLLIGLERSMIAELGFGDSRGQLEPTKDPVNSIENVPEERETLTRPSDRVSLAESKSDPTDLAARDSTAENEFIGLRTFAVLSLLGFVAAAANEHSPSVAAITIGGVILLIISLYWRFKEAGVGITTELAAIASCGLGMLCRTDPKAAGVIALILTALLASKSFAHETIQKMRRVELIDTLKFMAIIFIVLPLLPNEALDPYQAFNPYKVGLLVILISGISFVGYFLTRILGAQKGLGLTGILGGLTSSTAVTAAMSLEARETPSLQPICAFSTVAANATMFARVLVVVALLDQALALKLVWSIGAMAGVALIATGVLWVMANRRRATEEKSREQIKLKNPFSLGPAIKFSIFFVAILFIAKMAHLQWGDSGLYLACGLSGLADVDAITLSLAEQVKPTALKEPLDLQVAAIGITIAVVSNSVVKTGIAIWSGGWKFGLMVGSALGAATIAGLIVAFNV